MNLRPPQPHCEQITSISENTNSLFNIFPNPAQDQIEIGYPQKHQNNLNVKLYDSKGRIIDIILNENFQSEVNNVKLDISSLLPGAYFVNIQSESGSLTKSFIKE